MANIKVIEQVSEQQMSSYLDAVRERKNNRNPVETSTELGGAAVAGALGAVASYFTLKSTVPKKTAELIASGYLLDKHAAIREEKYRTDIAREEYFRETTNRIYGREAARYLAPPFDDRDPVRVRKYEIAEKLTPKVGTALALMETLGPAIGWSVYQYNTKNSEVLSFSMQQPAMHELASKWIEAEEFKAHAREIISEVAVPGNELRQRAIDELEAAKKVSVPYAKLNSLLNGGGVNQTIVSTELVPHDQLDKYKKAVDQEFYQQIQANPKSAEPYARLWLDFRDLEYGLDNSRLFEMHTKISLIAEQIERTGLAGYQMYVDQEKTESVMHDLTQSTQQEAVAR